MHVQDFEVLDVDMWEDSREASQDEGAELHEGSEPSEDSEPEEEEASRLVSLGPEAPRFTECVCQRKHHQTPRRYGRRLP